MSLIHPLKPIRMSALRKRLKVRIWRRLDVLSLASRSGVHYDFRISFSTSRLSSVGVVWPAVTSW